MNPEFDALMKAGRRRPLWSTAQSTQSVCYGREEIEQLIPHREPMLLLDAITEIDLAQGGARGLRRIAEDDPAFEGHFPGEPVYPGAFLLETMGQLGLSLMYFCEHQTITIKAGVAPRRLRLLKIHSAAFLAEVLPGDELTVLAKCLDMNEFTAIGAGQILKGGTVCAFAIMEVFLVGA